MLQTICIFLQVNEDFSGTCYVNQEETRIKYSVSDYNELNNNENKSYLLNFDGRRIIQKRPIEEHY